MVSLGESGSRQRVLELLGLGGIWSAGLVMGLFEIQHLRAMSSTVGIAVFALLPFIINIGLLVAGYAIWRSQFDGTETIQIAGWVGFGIIVIGLLATWTITHQNVRGRPFAHASFVTINNMSVGGMIGFLVGWYELSSRRHRRETEEERAKLAFLNRLLRHNILNGMQIIIGRTDLLIESVDDSKRTQLTTIRERGEEIARFVETVRLLGMSSLDTPDEPLQPVNLSDALATEVDAARQDFDQAEFSLTLPDDIFVVTDDFVTHLFTNLLTNAVQHNDKDTPQVTISANDTDETVVVSIADNGPGLADGDKEHLLERNLTEFERDGAGLGLAIATTLTHRYDGTLWIEDNDPTGTVVNVELPRARAG